MTVEKKVEKKFERYYEDIKVSAIKRIEEKFEEFEWRQYHDFGYVYRTMADIFWTDPKISNEDKKEWIKRVLHLAELKLTKAAGKKGVKGETYWELGHITYTLPVKYKLGLKRLKKPLNISLNPLNFMTWKVLKWDGVVGHIMNYQRHKLH